MGSFREFAIEPTLVAICVPASHTSGCVANDFNPIDRPQSLFVAVTKQWKVICRHRRPRAKSRFVEEVPLREEQRLQPDAPHGRTDGPKRQMRGEGPD